MSKELSTLQKQAEKLFELENFDELINLLPDEVLEKSKNAELYAWRARGHYRLFSESEKILKYAEKSIQANSGYFMGYLARGNGYNDKGEYDKAISDYDKAIELKPDYVDAFNNRGISWNDKGEYDKAISDHDKAIELKPDFELAYFNRGNSWDEKGEYDKAISDYGKAIELKPDYADAFNNRGISWKNKGEYDKAISDYDKAIELKPDFELAYFNRGNSWYLKGEYDKAISDYDKAIELKPDYANAFVSRGNSWDEKGEYDKAISDYEKAIELKPDYAIAFYNRGLLYRKKGNSFDKGKLDFELYLSLTPEKDDIWAKRAKEYIAELDEKLKDHLLSEISEITDKIKKLLLIENGCITHYTTMSTVKILIFDKESKFRISEGSFLNDTSEGTELFNFLGNQLFTRHIDGLLAATFAPKPFIGSFVSEDKHDDLNMWRFYGKEASEEAKGCAITIRMSEFIDGINDSLAKGTSEKSLPDSDDIKFYRVAYWNHDKDKVSFHIPNAEKKEGELNQLMEELRTKVTGYINEDKSVLEKYLNAIAFLFKSDAYKNENEIRLVVRGVEFEKKFDESATPPKVYIELVNIRGLIEQITLGPKVDKPDEWASAFHFQYYNENDVKKKPKKILISRLPYK